MKASSSPYQEQFDSTDPRNTLDVSNMSYISTGGVLMADNYHPNQQSHSHIHQNTHTIPMGQNFIPTNPTTTLFTQGISSLQLCGPYSAPGTLTSPYGGLFDTSQQIKHRRNTTSSLTSMSSNTTNDVFTPLFSPNTSFTHMPTHSNLQNNTRSWDYATSTSPSTPYDRRQSHPGNIAYYNNQPKNNESSSNSFLGYTYSNTNTNTNSHAYDLSTGTFTADSGNAYQRNISLDTSSSLYTTPNGSNPNTGTPSYNTTTFTTNTNPPMIDYSTQQNDLARSLPSIGIPNGVIGSAMSGGPLSASSDNGGVGSSTISSGPLSSSSDNSGIGMTGNHLTNEMLNKPPSLSSLGISYNNKSVSLNQKKHGCAICSKRFTRPSSLQTHMYSHTGEKPFKCEYVGCGKQFSVVSNLRRHRKIHENNNCSGS